MRDWGLPAAWAPRCCFAFLYIAAAGPGPRSLDARLASGSRR